MYVRERERERGGGGEGKALPFTKQRFAAAYKLSIVGVCRKLIGLPYKMVVLKVKLCQFKNISEKVRLWLKPKG